MKSQLFVLFALCALVSACGGKTPPATDAGNGGGSGGGGTHEAVCLDNDGDGVPGTGECTGVTPLDCNDQNAAVFPGATETCNDVDDNCNGQVDEGLEIIKYYRDQDGDGFGTDSNQTGSGCAAPPSGSVSNNTDCDDLNPNIHPGVAEVCDDVDQDCNGQVDDALPTKDFYPDGDGDGYGAADGIAQNSCKQSITGKVANNSDCDDAAAMIHPGAQEICNKGDDNCDGQVDNGITFINYYPDVDGDGHGDASAAAESSCSGVAGKVTSHDDCDDTNASIKPGAPEQCNGIDDNCNGQSEEGLTFSIYYPDSDGDGFGSSTGTPQSSCKPLTGKVTNGQDCDDGNAAIKPTATELCNNVDDNCNGQIDDGLTFQNYYVDADGDGYGAANGSAQNSCSALPGRVTNNSDCDDTRASVKPGATEVCNGLDDNCAGGVDEGLATQAYYPDNDGDGYGAAGSTVQNSCGAVPGKVTNNQDCDDTKATVKPGATEVCNAADDNCNGQVDEGLTMLSYYPDLDGDTYGAAGSSAQPSCSPVPGKVTNNTDCNDTNASVHPNAAELCNSVDDNCNGQIDDGVVTQAYYVDSDGDGYGASGTTPINSCSAITGRVTNNTDCNDNNSAVKPGAAEVCNGVDDNCSGQADEGLTFLSYYPDLDSDGFGASAATAQPSCSAVPGKVTNNTDCNDNNVNVHPGAQELCNGVDDNCAGGADEGLTFTNYYPDSDGDGYGSASATAVSACAPQSGKVTNNTDCNDGNAAVKPGATETCNNVDDNCNGQTDENNAGGGAGCNTGQAGLCAAGTLTCQSGALTCLRNVGPSTELCDGLDNDCDNSVDEDFTNKGTACTAGLGVCQNSGTYVCKADKSGTQCSATAGSPTTPACDGLDNDCDGVVDEPGFVSTADIQNLPWTRMEVAPYYYSASGCAGGTVGSGTDALAGGGLALAGGASSGMYFQKLTATGAPSGTPKSVTGFNYTDIGIAQAGDGFVIAGVWATNNTEIDIYYVDSTGTQRAYRYTQFSTGNILDSIRVVRGAGKRVTIIWREAGVGIKSAQVEPFYDSTAASWSLKNAGGSSSTLSVVTLVANTAVLPGIGADSAFIDWTSSQTCPALTTNKQVAISYIAPDSGSSPATHSVRHFTMGEDGNGITAEIKVHTATTSAYKLTEPETTFFKPSTTNQYMVTYIDNDLSTTSPDSDIEFWMTTAQSYHFAYYEYADQNGSNSIVRPRVSMTASQAWITAQRYVIDSSTYKRQVQLTHIDLATGNRVPDDPSIEISPTTGSCSGSPDCRPGNKDGLTSWASVGKVYYSGSTSSAGGAYVSTVVCQ